MKKGQPHTEETRKKISRTLKGHSNSPKGVRLNMSGEFKRGQVPWNKGTKGLMKANKTSFKKGSIPANYKGGMKIEKDGLYILTKERRSYPSCSIKQPVYQRLSRHRWEQAHGKIPDGMAIWHKDGDRFNDALENLEMISSLEAFKRNRWKGALKKKCSICGSEFLARTKRYKTCSKECNKKNNNLLVIKCKRRKQGEVFRPTNLYTTSPQSL